VTEPPPALTVVPVTPDRWQELAAFAEPNGFYSGCWCTWWQLSAKDWDAAPAAERRDRLAREVAGAPVPPGLLALRDGAVVGWVRVGPRGDHPRLQRSPKLKPVDDEPVWIVSCFVVRRDARRRGVGSALLRAAVEFARQHGAAAVEGVPIDATGRPAGAATLFTGTLAMFEAEGFVEIARRHGRPIVRRTA
jgi:GNAT superfamily N-acetyltransferase